jgi:hypothetical protein
LLDEERTPFAPWLFPFRDFGSDIHHDFVVTIASTAKPVQMLAFWMSAANGSCDQASAIVQILTLRLEADVRHSNTRTGATCST